MTISEELNIGSFLTLKKMKPIVEGWTPQFDENCGGIEWIHPEYKNHIFGQPFYDGDENMDIYIFNDDSDDEPNQIVGIDLRYLKFNYKMEQIDINGVVTEFLNVFRKHLPFVVSRIDIKEKIEAYHAD